MPLQNKEFDSLLEAVPDAMVGVDQAGVIRFINHRTELLFGYPREALVGEPLETLVPEALRQVHTILSEGYFADPQTRTMGAGLELSGRQRDGTEFPVDISLSQMESEDGLLVIAAVRDITDRKKTIEKQDGMRRLAAIVEHSDDAIIGKTLDGIITSWNPAAERLYGYATEEIIGRSVELLSPSDRADEMSVVLGKIRAGQPVDPHEAVRVRKDRVTIPVSLTVSPIRDAHGVIVGASTITRDVTKQMQAFESARSMIESSLDSLVAISPEGKITDVNEATVKVTGVPREQLIGTEFSDYFTDPDQANEGYQRAFAQGAVTDYPLTMRHRDGTLTEVLYNASVYRDAGGNVLGVFAAARDVTEQKQVQAAMAQQTKELDRLAELERFQRLTVGRELKMIELKKEIEYLKKYSQGEGAEHLDQQ